MGVFNRFDSVLVIKMTCFQKILSTMGRQGGILPKDFSGTNLNGISLNSASHTVYTCKTIHPNEFSGWSFMQLKKKFPH
uniref:Uncharacterized protein n=1 Tax=Anguilla anguilla TaxID=7936 RepID=A0A0E9XJP5_ANGAN